MHTAAWPKQCLHHPFESTFLPACPNSLPAPMMLWSSSQPASETHGVSSEARYGWYACQSASRAHAKPS